MLTAAVLLGASALLAEPEAATVPTPAPSQERERPAGGRAAGRAADAVALASFALLAVALFSATWAHPQRSLIGTGADPGLFVWFLALTHHAVLHGQSVLTTHLVGGPGGENLMSVPGMPLAGFVLTPITSWLGPMVAYNLLVTANVALSGGCTYLVLRRYTAGRVGPWLGGMVYALSPYLLAQSLGHPNLTAAFVPPLLVALLDEILVGQRRSAVLSGMGLGLLVVGQLLLSTEMLVTEAIAGLAGLLVLVVVFRSQLRSRAGHAVKALAVGIGVAAGLGAWPVWLALVGAGHLHVSSAIQAPGVFVGDLLGFVVPSHAQAIAPVAAAKLAGHFSATGPEADTYLGIPLLAVAGLSAWRCWSRPVVRVMAPVGVIMAVLSLGPQLRVAGHLVGVPLPWALVQHVPVLIDVLPVRLALYVVLCAAILLAVLVDQTLPARAAGPAMRPQLVVGRWVVVSAASLAVLGTLFPRLAFPSTTPVVPGFFLDRPRPVLAGPVLLTPVASSESLVWQAVSGMTFSLDEDQVAPSPGQRALERRLEAIQAGQLAPLPGPQSPGQSPGLRRALARDCLGTVVVGPGPHAADVAAFFTSLLDRPPAAEGGVAVWSHLSGSRFPGCPPG